MRDKLRTDANSCYLLMPLRFHRIVLTIIVVCTLCIAGGGVVVAAAPDSTARSRERELPPPRRDTTTKPPVVAVPAAPPHIPIAAHGRISLLPMPAVTIDKRDLELLPYLGLPDILRQKLPTLFPLSLGSYGQNTSFAALGGDARDVSLRFNGRPLNSPTFGSFNLEQFPPEMAESFEIFTGMDAVIFGDNSSGMLVNVQEARHNIKTPYTRLWFAQGEYDYIASDGVFSQNIAENLNTTVGFRRQFSSGRFANSGFDIWNVRGALRYSPSDETTFTLTEVFTNHGLGTSGGLAADSPSFTDVLTATPRMTDLDERVYRHDVTLAGSWRPDSAFAASGSAFFSHEDWEKNRGEEYFTSPSDTVRLTAWSTVTAGATARLEQKISDSLFLRAGGELTWVNSAASVYAEALAGTSLAGYFHASWILARGTALKAGTRIRIDQDRTTLALGGAISLQILKNLQVTADISRSDRTPTPTEGHVLPAESHLLGIGGLRYGTDSAGIDVLLFSRYISSPIESQRILNAAGNTTGTLSVAGDTRTITGGSVTGRVLVLPMLFMQGWVQSYYSTTNGTHDNRLPSLYTGVSAQYEYRVGASRLIAGASAAFLTGHKGDVFVPQTWNYVPAEAATSASFDGLSVYMSAKLGNARLRVAYTNLLSSRIEYVPYYPEIDRNIRISLAWAFND